MSGQFPGMILADADFMIHGVFRYTLFGQELYITTTHVAMFIVTIIILIIMSVVVWVFAWSKKKLVRWHGAAMLVSYAIYLVYICMR